MEPRQQTTSNSKMDFLTSIRRRFSVSTLFLVIIGMWAVLAFMSPYFLTYPNLFNLARQTAVIAVVSVGMTFVIISGGIDLSVGSIVAVSGIWVSMMMLDGVPIVLAILLTILACCLLGLVSGIAVFDGKVPPFIATLGMMSVARGMALMFSGGRIITGLPRAFTSFSQLTFLGIPSLFLILLVLAVISHIVLTRTRFGRNVYTIGSSQEVAKLSGINMRFNIYGIYMLSAGLAAVAGIMLTSRLSSGLPTSGQSDELDAIAAVVIGGASLSGAEGSIFGTLLGALIMSTLRNGFNLLGLDPFWMRIAIGFLIVMAVLADQIRKNR